MHFASEKNKFCTTFYKTKYKNATRINISKYRANTTENVLSDKMKK